MSLRRLLPSRGQAAPPTRPFVSGGATLPEEEELPASLVPLVRRRGIELRDSRWRG